MEISSLRRTSCRVRVAERLSIDPYHCVTESTRRPNICRSLFRSSKVIAALNGESVLRAIDMLNANV